MYVLSRAGPFCYYKVFSLDQRVDLANSVRMNTYILGTKRARATKLRRSMFYCLTQIEFCVIEFAHALLSLRQLKNKK